MGRIVLQNQSNVVEQRVPFTFISGSLVLQQVFPGDIIDSAWVLIDTPFDDPAASILLGTTLAPGLIFGLGDVTSSVVDQYANQAVTEFALTEFLVLTISPGASTQGSGRVIYRFWN
jgi:hypothetical protein